MKMLIFFCLMGVAVVLAQDCATDENAIDTDCGSYCVYTCQHPRPPGSACIDVCVPGCFCKRNFTLNEETKKCVKLADCPKKL